MKFSKPEWWNCSGFFFVITIQLFSLTSVIRNIKLLLVMKLNLILLAILTLLSGSIHSQSKLDKFIVGGLIVNLSDSYTSVFDEEWRKTYFDTVKAFGLNYAEYSVMEDGARIPNKSGVKAVSSKEIRALLSSMSERGIRARLNTYAIFDTWTERMPFAKRWVFQAEEDSGFTQHVTGENWFDPEGEKHYHRAKDSTAPTVIKLDTKKQKAGLVCGGIRISDWANDAIPAGEEYYVKIRARLFSRQLTRERVPVLQVIVINKESGDTQTHTIYSNDLTHTFSEVTTVKFTKKPGGKGKNQYDVELHWLGTQSCVLDYVAIDDVTSHKLHTGAYDKTVIRPTIEAYKDHPGVGSFLVWDEPYPPHYYAVRYVNRKIREYLKGTGYEQKIGMAFNVMNSWSSEKFLHETDQDIHLTDLYQFHGWVLPPDGKKGTYNQYHSLQFGIEADGVQAVYDKIYDYVSEQAAASRKFGKEYVIALQGHSWKIGEEIRRFQYLREPSLYEMLAQANIAIGVGAHGIMWNKYSPTESWERAENNEKLMIQSVGLLSSVTRGNPCIIIPRYQDAYGLPKWEGLKAFHHYLHRIGDLLLKLEFQSSWLLHKSRLTEESVIESVRSGRVVRKRIEVFPENKNFVQCSYFKGPDPDGMGIRYIHLVNRRTHNADTSTVISIRLKKLVGIASWKIEDAGNDKQYTVQDNGSLSIPFSAGEGKLLKIIPVYRKDRINTDK